MKSAMSKSFDPGYFTMMFLVILGLLVLLGTFVLGPIMTFIR